MNMQCWECGDVGAVHDHHPVPQSRGGRRTIPLCEACHAKAHHRDKNMTTSALTRAALGVKAARGEKVGGVQTYGIADGIDAERADCEREILAAVAELRAAGMPIRQIAAELTARGMRTRRGGAIQPTQVARICSPTASQAHPTT